MTRPRPEPPLEILEGLRHPVPMAEGAGAERRKETIDAIARSIRGGRRRQRRTRGIAISSAVAALMFAAAAAFLVGHAKDPATRSAAVLPHDPVGGELQVTGGIVVATCHGIPSALPRGSAAHLDAGDEIRSAADGRAKLLLPRGVRVDLDGSTNAEIRAVSELEQRLRLDLGKTTVSVPRPGGPREFSIETPDSQVIVHGTEFSVLVEQDGPSASTFTTVAVTRGAVLIVHGGDQRLIQAGDRWSSRPASVPPPRDWTALEDLARDTERPLGESSSRAHRSGGHNGPLAEQNRLFQAALDARKAGDDARAVEYLNELLTRFPQSTLAREAKLARLRAEQRLEREK